METTTLTQSNYIEEEIRQIDKMIINETIEHEKEFLVTKKRDVEFMELKIENQELKKRNQQIK